MSVPAIAQQLNAAGLGCFPCAVRFDTTRNKWAKQPITVRIDESSHEPWSATAARPLTDPAVRWEGVTVVGVPVPAGVVILDGDWYNGGASREHADQVFGGALPWAEALIQATIGGGEHYAFRLPEWEVRQGSNFGGSNVDTRVAGKGFICTGEGYAPSTFGCMRLAYPQALPVLPDHCRALLEAPTVGQAPTAAPETIQGEDVQLLEQALAHISPDIGHDEWIRYGMALRHQFESDPDAGFALFDKWSYAGFSDEDCPPSYIPEDVSTQYWKLKPTRGDGTATVTVATIFYRAIENGWIPPSTFDTSSAFGEGAASPGVFAALVARINESGTDITQTEQIVAEILEGRCNALQRDLLTLALKAALKEAKLLDKGLSGRLDTLLRPDGAPRLPVVAPTLPDVVDIDDLVTTPLSRASGNHGINAEIMKNETFAGRLASYHGELRWWSGREWQRIPDETLARTLFHALMPDHSKTPNVNGTTAALKALADPLGESVRGSLMFFNDCVLDVRTGQVTGHCPSNCNRGSLLVPRVDATATPEWSAFLHQIFGGSEDGEDRIALLQEIMGWAMLQDDLNVHKIVAFDGASRAGKGVILEVLQAIMGADKCGVVTFANIDDGKTQSAFRSHDVMVDLEAKPPASQTLKNAIGFMNKVASNEAVSIQLLNTQQPWTGRLNCKLIIACNGIPALLDDSGATTNRFVVLFFTRSFKGKEDRGLLGRLLPEIDAIAAWAAQGAHRLATNGGVFTDPKTSAEALCDMRDTNQPLREFMDNYFVFDGGNRCTSGDIWAAYRLYAAEANVRLGTKNAFGRSLKRALLGQPCEYHRQLRVGGTVSSGYDGFKIRDLVVGTATASAFQPTVVK